MGDLFAFFALMRPIRLMVARTGQPIFPKKATRGYKRDVPPRHSSARSLKDRAARLPADTDCVTKVPVFLRFMRMVQGKNQSLGPPVNPIRITTTYASRSRSCRASA